MRSQSLRNSSFAVIACTALAVSANAFAATQSAPQKPAPKLEHPGDVALIEDADSLLYRQFPTGLRLYINDRDTPGHPTCIKECAFAWPPLIAHEGAKPMGDWTLITREGGEKQWAYKGHPVYMLFHDSPSEPQGNGAEGVWHFLEP